jgi:hypothetical protein
MPRSSVAAVLARRGALGLDDAQVRGLEQIEAALEKRQASLGARPQASGSAAAAPGAASPSAGDAPPPQEASPGSRGTGGHRGGGRRSAGEGREPARAARAPLAAWDDEDTAAFYRAQELLRPEQRDAARDVAERYRGQLYDARAQRGQERR